MGNVTTALLTHDGRHFVCAEEDGRVTADRLAAGPWEHWTVETHGDQVALRSAHGHYLCAELDGAVVADRDRIGSWELWTPIVDGDQVALRSAHGRYLVAEGGGGSTVRADRASVGVWERVTPTVAWWTAPAASGLSRLRVEANRRYFANDAGRFDWREITAFSLLSRLLRSEREVVTRWLRRRRAEGFTVTRVIGTLDGGYWAGAENPLGQSFRCAPDMPDYWRRLDELVALHADAGLYMRFCYLGALEPFGGVWYPDRRDVFDGDVQRKAEAYVVEAAQRLGVHAHVVGELANEPTQIGMRHSWPKLIALGRRVKAVSPSTMLCGGEDNDGLGVVAPFDFADAHMDRSMGVAGWQWVKRSGEHPTADQDVMPFVAGEPINFGEARRDGRTGDVEAQPAVAFGAAAVGRIRRWAGQCFHFDGGLWTTEPQAETPTCLAAWHRGMDAVPMGTESLWRGHWGLPRGDYWRDVWPDTDDPREVEQRVRDGHPWRAFGRGAYSVVFPQPKGWDWKAHLDAPATRVALETSGTFDCAVYRRTPNAG
jgi:hypothetical protein